MKNLSNILLEKLKINKNTKVSKRPLEKGQFFIVIFVESNKYIGRGSGDNSEGKFSSLEDVEKSWGEDFNKKAEPKIPRKFVKAFYENDSEISNYIKELENKGYKQLW